MTDFNLTYVCARQCACSHLGEVLATARELRLAFFLDLLKAVVTVFFVLRLSVVITTASVEAASAAATLTEAAAGGSFTKVAAGGSFPVALMLVVLVIVLIVLTFETWTGGFAGGVAHIHL